MKKISEESITQYAQCYIDFLLLANRATNSDLETNVSSYRFVQLIKIWNGEKVDSDISSEELFQEVKQDLYDKSVYFLTIKATEEQREKITQYRKQLSEATYWYELYSRMDSLKNLLSRLEYFKN